MQGLEGIFLWAAISLYLISFFVVLYVVVFRSQRQSRKASMILVAAFVFHTLTIAVRWYVSGHAPVLGKYEHALAGGWFISAVYVISSSYYPAVRVLSIVVSPLILLLVGNGMVGESLATEPLPPPYQSNWLWVHAGFGWMAYGAYHVSAAAAVLYLIKERAIRMGREDSSRIAKLMPSLPAMDGLIFKLIIFGFIAHIVMLGVGAIWAYSLWGRYWGWDPIEIWTLISWLIYGLNIHLRATYGWKGRRGAWLAIISLSGVIIFFGGIGFTKGVHTPLL